MENSFQNFLHKAQNTQPLKLTETNPLSSTSTNLLQPQVIYHCNVAYKISTESSFLYWISAKAISYALE